MVAFYMRFILMVNFQIVLMAARGITLPLNSVTTKIESFKIQPPNVDTPSELDATSIIQAYSSNEPESYCKSLQVPTLDVMVPKIDNGFNKDQSYSEECALKYGYSNKIYLPLNNNSAQNLSIKESAEYLVDFIPPSTTSILNLPLKLSSSVTPLDSLSVSPTITKFNSSVSSSFDSSNILSVTDSNSKFTNLPLSISYIISPGISRSALDLEKSVEASKSKSMSPTGSGAIFPSPVSSSSTVSTLPNFENTDTMLLTSLHSYLTFPLSVTSKTTSAKPSQSADEFSCLPISPSLNSFLNSLPSPLLPPQTYHGEKIFVPTPNTLPKPLIPSASDSQGVGSFLPTSSSEGSQPPIFNLLDSNLNQYSNPTISSTEHITYGLANNCPKIPTPTVTLQTYHEIYTELIKNYMNFARYGTKLTSSSLYRNCHSLKPFPPYNFPFSTNTFPLSILSPSPNLAPQGLDIMPISRLTESNSYQNLPSSLLKLEAAPASILENNLIASQSTSLPEIESTYELLSLNSLSSTSSLPLSSSNCLSPTQNLPILSSTSNSFLLSNDISCPLLISEEPDYKTFEHSPGDNVESENIIPAQFINSVEVNETIIKEPNTAVIHPKKLSPNSVKKLLQLTYLLEIMNNDENCDYRALNEIVSLLTV